MFSSGSILGNSLFITTVIDLDTYNLYSDAIIYPGDTTLVSCADFEDSLLLSSDALFVKAC